MLVEINKADINNFDVRTAIKTLRDHGMHPFKDGYYYAYITPGQNESLVADPTIINVHQYAANPLAEAVNAPAVYGCKFFVIHQHDQPARFFGSHLPMMEQNVELAKVNP